MVEPPEIRSGLNHKPPAAMDFAEVICPTCFESFEVALPPPDEWPAELDYDCEICCRPMRILLDESGVRALGMGD